MQVSCGDLAVKNVTNAATYHHISHPVCNPQQHDLENFHSTYRNSAGTNMPTSYNLNASVSSAADESVVQHQLSSTRFSTSGLMSGGVVYNVLPIPAIALTPVPAASHSVFSSHYETATPPVEVLTLQEQNSLASTHTVVLDPNHLIALGPTDIQAGRKTSGNDGSQAFDVYEFLDEDDSEMANKGIGFRRAKQQRSVTDSASSLQSSSMNDHEQSTKKCPSASETDANVMSALPHVAVIFDMDSKSVRRVSLPVKMEPAPVPLTVKYDASLPFCHSTNNMTDLQAGHRKRYLPISDMNPKTARLGNINTSGHLVSENTETDKHLRNLWYSISDISDGRKMDERVTTFTNRLEKSCQSRPVDFTAAPSTLNDVRGHDLMTPCYATVRLVDLSAKNPVTNASCSKGTKSDNKRFSSFSHRSPHTWLYNGNRQGTASNSSSNPASSHQQKGTAVSQLMEDKCSYSSDINWWHIAKTDNYSTAQTNYVKPNAFGNVSVKGRNKRDVSENLQSDVCALDLSSVSPCISHVTPSQSFHPAAATLRYNDNQIWTTASGSLPFNNHQQQPLQKVALNVKKEETKMTMLSAEEKLMNRLKSNLIEEVPRCQCKGRLHEFYYYKKKKAKDSVDKKLLKQYFFEIGTPIDINDLITTANFGGDRLRGGAWWVVKICHFP